MTASLLAVPQLSSAQYEQGHEHHQDFYNGATEGGRGGEYNRGQDYGYGQRGSDNRGYDDRYHGHGVGTGTGAAIGGAGGALLGAAFGGGLKGAIIGGAAGAGIGAVAGHAHEQDEKRNYYEHR